MRQPQPLAGLTTLSWEGADLCSKRLQGCCILVPTVSVNKRGSWPPPGSQQHQTIWEHGKGQMALLTS